MRKSDPDVSESLLSRHGLKLLLISGALGITMHLALGADPVVVCIATITVCIGLYPVARFGFLNIGALLILLVMFRYIGFPLIGKLLFLQPLDSNLHQPLGAFVTVLLGALAYLFAFMMLMKLDLKRTILMPTMDAGLLQRISIIAMVIGCAANFSFAVHAGKDYTGITVSNFFMPIMHLALIAAIAAELCASKGKRTWNYWILTIIVVEIVFVIVQNSRLALLEIVLCYFATTLAFHGRVKWANIGAAGAAAVLLVAFMTPAMLHVRGERSHLSWTQRITATIAAVSEWPTAFEYYQIFQLMQKRDNYHLNYYGSPQNILERMSLINHVDVIKHATDKHRPVGFKDLKIAFKRSLPRAIAPDKPLGYGHGDWLYCQANIECMQGSYATVPLIANGYAAFKWFGAIFYPFLLGSGLLLLLKVVSGYNLTRNIWGIYLFVRIQHGFIEDNSAHYLQLIIRDIPQDVIVLIAIVYLAGMGSFDTRKPSPSA